MNAYLSTDAESGSRRFDYVKRGIWIYCNYTTLKYSAYVWINNEPRINRQEAKQSGNRKKLLRRRANVQEIRQITRNERRSRGVSKK